MPSASEPRRQDRLLWGLILLTFFFLLGSRALNEPDEGRYGEIAREMVETGDWMVPHIWYVPHLDKPPLTYWLVGLSLKLFGFNAWAVRLPLALAGLSGVWAAYRFALEMGNREMARWAALILSSSLLYFGMARMLTTDIILTQFIAWALYFFWRSWRCLDDLTSEEEEKRGQAGKRFFLWQIAAWVAISGGFLAKGPIVLLLALAPLMVLMVRRRDYVRNQLVLMGTVGGLAVFGLLAVPWFMMIFQHVPESFSFMVKGQVVKHAMGAESKGRAAPFYYFIPILLGGFLPWTLLLGWLWRPAYWRSLTDPLKEAWLFLGAWVLLTFVFFSINSAKLPAYIVPLFPGLAVLVALRWRAWEDASLPRWVARGCMASPPLLMFAAPVACYFAFKINDQSWLWPVAAVGMMGFVVVLWLNRTWPLARCMIWAHRLALVNLFVLVALVPTIETRLKSNQTLKPLGEAIQREFKPGDKLVIWGRFPQGLPFYAYPTINATNRPYLGGMPHTRLPLEFPGNVERLGPLLLRDEKEFGGLLRGEARVLVVGYRSTFELSRSWAGDHPLRLLATVGDWEFFTNR